MPSYKIKDPSEISSQQVLVLLESISYLQSKLKEVREKCKHDFEAVERSWYDDGWSQVDSEEEHRLHCKICGHYEYGIKTGKIIKCY